MYKDTKNQDNMDKKKGFGAQNHQSLFKYLNTN